MEFGLEQWNCSIKISVELSITLIGFILLDNFYKKEIFKEIGLKGDKKRKISLFAGTIKGKIRATSLNETFNGKMVDWLNR